MQGITRTQVHQSSRYQDEIAKIEASQTDDARRNLQAANELAEAERRGIDPIALLAPDEVEEREAHELYVNQRASERSLCSGAQ